MTPALGPMTDDRENGNDKDDAMGRYRLNDCWSPEHPTDVDAYIWALRELRARTPDLYAALRERCATKARTFFARTPVGLFLATPDLADEASHYRRLDANWYADTNLKNQQKEAVLIKACGVAGIQYGKDFEVRFNPEHYSPLSRQEVDRLFGELGM